MRPSDNRNRERGKRERYTSEGCRMGNTCRERIAFDYQLVLTNLMQLPLGDNVASKVPIAFSSFRIRTRSIIGPLIVLSTAKKKTFSLRTVAVQFGDGLVARVLYQIQKVPVSHLIETHASFTRQ